MTPLCSPLRRAPLALLPALVLALAGSASADAAGLTVRGSAEQVQVTGAAPGARITLTGPSGRRTVQRVGRLGGAVFRHVTPGRGYRVRVRTSTSATVTVLSTRGTPPSTRGYRQAIPKEGYGYLATRDGTKLAIDVHLPAGGGKGPFPTLIEYAGYGYANPAGGESSIAQIATLLGYAVVDVNMRGTGCSGGAFDYFEPLQGLDGYDVVETVSRQPWVLHGRAGMMGISYGGISQLFVGATRPPHLAAIAPLSVVDNTATTLYPGGLLNTGFALAWARDRVDDAKPATATTGQGWALERIRGGDKTCKANQVLHAQAVDLLAKSRANSFYVPAVADPVSPVTFVHRIQTPVFLACQWTDEQTGGHCPTLAARFTGTGRKWFTFTNGTHIDSLDPATFTRWYDFLELYVARRAPNLPQSVRDAAPLVFKAASGVPDVTLPDDPIQGRGSYAEALAAFEAQPPVRVLFDNGAGSATAGKPVPGYERSFARLPVPGTTARTWFIDADGALGDTPAATAGADAFTWDPTARPATDFSGNTSGGEDGLWTAAPPYRWQQPPLGTAAAYVSAPLVADVTVIGAGAVQAWVRSTAPDVDLQATVSEVRPDGRETFVQSGWLRASKRALDRRTSTTLTPNLTLRRADAAPLPAGRWTHLTIPLYYQGHAYRAGSRLRVTLSAPGADQPVWGFAETVPKGKATVAVARSAARPSKLILPVVPGPAIPTPLPPCPGLRGEPCRPYAATPNTKAPAALGG
jgi:uncharacterized protein